MKAWLKVVLGISLSFMCLFSCLGYAGFTSALTVKGEAELLPPNAIFIVGISNVRTSGATVNTSPVNIGFPSTKVMSEIVFNGRNSSVSFDVLIKNGTDFTQYFDILEEYDELEGVEGSFSYSNTEWTVSPGQGTELKSGEQKTFTVTLKLTRNYSNQTRKMLHEFDFTPDSNDLTEIVSKDITDKFEDILNNNLEHDISYVYNGRQIDVPKDKTYDQVIEQMEVDRNTGNYIGNLMGSDGDDKALLSALFEGALTFTIGNEEVPITVMIKEKDVYGSTEKDMVLFITADTLSAEATYVPVYASVYSKNELGDWEHVGEIFAGEAKTNNYNYGSWGTQSGSFDTESWRSTEEYYGIASGSGIKTVMGGYTSQNP